METTEFKKFLSGIGYSVHSMNTIAVGLSKLDENNCDIPKGLDISWKPNNIENSKTISRSYAEKSAIVYSVESFFNYLEKISENPFWNHPEINFSGDLKKSVKVYNFLNQIPKITEEMKILSEFACIWRNKIVHASASKAKLDNGKIGRLRKLRKDICNTYHHFDINTAFENYENNKITLKDASTLITILIKSARLIDEFFFEKFSIAKCLITVENSLYEYESFNKICKLQDSKKRDRQIFKFINMTYPFLIEKDIKKIADDIKSRSKS